MEVVDLLKYEKELYEKGYNYIAGTDEVGRGPLVGPVVAAAVILPKNYELEGLTDSKKLSEKKRNLYYDIIMRDAIAVGVGVISERIIDEINILEASRLAMNTALDNLKVKPDYILSDAMKLDRNVEVLPIIHGDALSLSISAASVIAKVTRDRMMEDLGKIHPEYEFERHKGYPTKRHIELVKEYGVLEEYRKTFKPICDILKESEKIG
ncbi:MAG: ribonuclease HII [Bacilli bacterium]|nr:ribonuclease HII [Bacilli bacterium]MBQ8901449.1 ribonuclease HII [Bacilli bacterium]